MTQVVLHHADHFSQKMSKMTITPGVAHFQFDLRKKVASKAERSSASRVKVLSRHRDFVTSNSPCLIDVEEAFPALVVSKVFPQVQALATQMTHF